MAVDERTLRLGAKDEWEPLVGPGEGVDQEEACSFLNKGPLHGLEGRGRGMSGVEEDKVPAGHSGFWV